MNDTQKKLLCLLSCAVNGITPDSATVQEMDPDELYRLAKLHSVRGTVCIALKRAGVENKPFDQAYKKAVRNNIYFELERSAVLAEFEQQGIWYMPLKGSVLKDLYPENGMREMADSDILYDAGKRQQVKEIMLSHGYEVKSFGRWHHDVYMKPPVLNFELHTALFSENHDHPVNLYYADVKRLLRKDDGNRFGYHFSDEDFYIYMTAHEWVHYSRNGTGIRSLMDCYVYCKAKGNTLDWEYITKQCGQLAIADFEQKRRKLAFKVFSADTLPDLTDEETDMLRFYLSAGTYGSLDHGIRNELKNQSKAGFLLRQIFPDMNYMKHSVAFVNKVPLLYPAGLVFRWGRILIFHRDHIKKTLGIVIKQKK